MLYLAQIRLDPAPSLPLLPNSLTFFLTFFSLSAPLQTKCGSVQSSDWISAQGRYSLKELLSLSANNLTPQLTITSLFNFQEPHSSTSNNLTLQLTITSLFNLTLQDSFSFSLCPKLPAFPFWLFCSLFLFSTYQSNPNDWTVSPSTTPSDSLFYLLSPFSSVCLQLSFFLLFSWSFSH